MGRIEPLPTNSDVPEITPRQMTQREKTLNEAAQLFQQQGAILRFHGNPYTGVYTHFEVLAWRGDEES